MKENSNVKKENENIYSKIIDKEYTNFKLNKIILGTKQLISNNINFKDYSKEYEEITKITTFKTPDEDYFPLLKNKEYISLTRIQYSYDSRKNKIKKFPKFFTPKSSMKKFTLSSENLKQNMKHERNNIELNFPKNIISLSRNDLDENKKFLNKIKEYKYNNNNCLSEEISENKNKIKLDSEINSSIFSSKQQTINNKNILLSPLRNSSTTQTSFFDKNKKGRNRSDSMNYYKNIKNRNLFIIKNNLVSFIKYKKNLYNNRILLRDILLKEKDYFNLKYEEEKIFLSSDYYNEYILEQMSLIRKNKLKIQYPDKFEKIYENSKYNHPNLTMYPIVVEFRQNYSFDNKNFNLNDKQIFNIPFEYIPVFYYDNMEKLDEILVSIFYLDQNLTTFFPKYENIGYILRTSQEFKEKNNNFNNTKKDIFKKAFTYKLQLSHSQTLNKSTHLFRGEKRPSVKKNKDNFKLIDIFTTEYNFNTKPEYLNNFSSNNNYSSNRNKEKLYFNNKNVFEFIWLTSSFQYLVTLKTPEISFKINGIEIRKNIDIELLLFLSKNNFKNWDFYLIEYLFSYYDFILIINSFLTKYKSNSKLIRSLKYKFDYKNNYINLTREKRLKYSKKSTKLEYIFTDDNLTNSIKILHNYKLFVFNKKLNPYYQFCFHLNFTQMKAMYMLSKKQSIKYIIEKIIIINQENMKIKLNYEYLNNFCKNDLNNIEPLLLNTIPIKGNKYNFNINDTKFCLFYPILETIKFNNNAARNQSCFESNLEEEVKYGMNMNIFESLFKSSDIYKWPSIIEFIDNKEKLKKQKKRVTLFPNLCHNDLISNIKSLNTISSKKLNFINWKE